MEDTAVWKALADETRRGLLDSLKKRPATTGELCEEFAHLDRCTIMKHLCVLEHSNLITFRREGRNRMNFLNPVQLQKIHTRWLTSYTAQRAQSLLNLKERAEGVAPAMPMENTTTLETRAAKYAFDVDIKAPKEKVWNLLTNDSSWFPDAYNSNPRTKGFVMEQKVGGIFYEDYGDGNGKMMGMVVGLDVPNRVQVQGPVTTDFGGPATHMFTMELIETAEGCTFKFDDALFGVFPDELLQGRQGAFRDLFGTHLKIAAEKTS
ncbi:MAG: helix-turn-helix domain-containing protein [Armatimonadetes bacterium]|nr:helix-turn-helix domain-containing protein [Armatimonadota bacterium]